MDHLIQERRCNIAYGYKIGAFIFPTMHTSREDHHKIPCNTRWKSDRPYNATKENGGRAPPAASLITQHKRREKPTYVWGRGVSPCAASGGVDPRPASRRTRQRVGVQMAGGGRAGGQLGGSLGRVWATAVQILFRAASRKGFVRSAVGRTKGSTGSEGCDHYSGQAREAHGKDVPAGPWVRLVLRSPPQYDEHGPKIEGRHGFPADSGAFTTKQPV